MSSSKKILLPALILVSLAATTLIYWWRYQKPQIGIDDANIYFVYMRNFAEGHGFVWDIKGEKVEGFSSLLWTLTGAVCYKISPGNLHALLFCVAFFLAFLTIYRILLFSRRLNHTEAKGITLSEIFILALILSSFGFIEWQILSLLETALWTFLLVNTTLQLCNYYFTGKRINILSFSLMLILLNLTRPESIAFNFLFLIILAIMFNLEHGRTYSIRKMIVPVLAHLVSLGLITVWRLSYFGYPFPNTFYATVSFNLYDNITGGLQYLITFISYPHAAIVTSILVLFCLFLLHKLIKQKTAAVFTNEEKSQVIILAVIFSGLALPLITGGDHFKYNRFYQPLLPLMYLSVTHRYMWTHYFRFSKPKNKIATPAIVLLLVFLMFFFSRSTLFHLKLAQVNVVDIGIKEEFEIAKEGRKVAEKLNETFASRKEYPSIGPLAAGGVGYLYKGKTIDMLGLNNTIMAHALTVKSGLKSHASFDTKGFWLLRPDMMGTIWGAQIVDDTSNFILPENTENFRSSDFAYLCYKGLFDERAFREVYFPALVKKKGHDYFIFDYYKRTFLQSLDTTAYVVKNLKRKYNPESNSFTALLY